MNAVKFLFAAYIATWVIHGVYLGSLVRRFSRLRQQAEGIREEVERAFGSPFPVFRAEGLTVSCRSCLLD